MSKKYENDEDDRFDDEITDGFFRSKKKISQELGFLTSQITDRVKFLSLAIIGGSWTLISAGNPENLSLYISCIGLAVVTIIIDFFQYLSSYSYFSNLDKKMRRDGLELVVHDPKNVRYRMRWVFFDAKIITSLILSCLFIYTVFAELQTKLPNEEISSVSEAIDEN